MTSSEARVRLLDDGELAAAARLVSATMLGSVASEVTDDWAQHWRGQTSHGAFQGAELAGVARWFPAELSFAGPSLPAACVTAVAVASNHRRQGHLRRLMAEQLRSMVDAEVPIGLLVAAEWPIYGRYGYGPAVDACGFEVDARTARFVAPRTGAVELVGPHALRGPLEAAHDARWRRTMGAITRTASTWDRLSGVAAWPGDTSDPGQRRGAIWRDDAGVVQGAVAYSVHDRWTRNRPDGRIEVSLLVGATPEAERELWRHLCEVDWVSTVVAGVRGIDDPLPFFLQDARAAAAVDRSDCIWARILDLPRVIGARRSAVAGAVVVEVVDDDGPAGGRWLLELGPDGGSASSTDRSVEVRLPVAALGAACLGGASLTRLHQADWMDEEAPGAVARLDALLRAPIAPWAPTTF